MFKQLAVTVVGFLGPCLSLVAQETNRVEQAAITLEQFHRSSAMDPVSMLALDRPDNFSTADGLPALTILGGRHFFASSALGRMGMTPLDLFPLALLPAEGGPKANLSRMYGTNSSAGMGNFLRLDPTYSSGEAGVYYGRSGGKYSSEVMGTYIFGTVGNDKFQITAGASYEEWSGMSRVGTF